jgi:hypothetical protein
VAALIGELQSCEQVLQGIVTQARERLELLANLRGNPT